MSPCSRLDTPVVLGRIGTLYSPRIEIWWFVVAPAFAPGRQIGVFSFAHPGSSCPASLRPENIVNGNREMGVVTARQFLARLNGAVARTSSTTPSSHPFHPPPMRVTRSSNDRRWNVIAYLRDAVHGHPIGGRKLGMGAKVGDYLLYQGVSASSSGPVGRGHVSRAFNLHVL